MPTPSRRSSADPSLYNNPTGVSSIPCPPTSTISTLPSFATTPEDDSLHPFALSSLLSSVSPAHDFTTASLALHAAGFATYDAVTHLLSFEQKSVDLLLGKLVQQVKMSIQDAERVREVVGKLKQEMGA
jgi:hypothetical protein